jgi:hypothetical protein
MSDTPACQTKTIRAARSLARFVRTICGRYVSSYDPVRRRRVRAAAERLVPNLAYSDLEATEDEIPPLCLLRALHLQPQVRRAAHSHQSEATVLLAHVPGARTRFAGGAAKDMKRLLVDITDDLGSDLLDEAMAHLGREIVPVPGNMIEPIIVNGGPDSVRLLYRRFYVPLSALYSHTRPMALSRYVHPRTNRTRRRPYAVSSRRSAVNAADAMVGLLASAVADEEHRDHELFREYAEAHWAVAWAPLLFIVRGLSVSRVHWRHMLPLVLRTRELRKQFVRGEKPDEEDVNDLTLMLARVVGVEADDPGYQALASWFRRTMLSNPSDDGVTSAQVRG